MKLSVIAAVVASAGLAQVAATPIRIVIASGHQEGVNPLDGARFGHSVLPPAVATWKAGTTEDNHVGPAPGVRIRRPCHGRMSRIRQKGIEISNTFRKALGLPLIETNPQVLHAGGKVHGGFVHIFPPSVVHQWEEKQWSKVPTANQPSHVGLFAPPEFPPHHRNHRLHHHGFRGRNGAFTARLHHALMHLGRWEGRAVAFVLGCGIGVLLRMFWVLVIVTYRTIKGQREDEHEYSHITIIEEYDETPVHTPPPTYIYPVDEKVALEEDKAPEAPVTAEESK